MSKPANQPQPASPGDLIASFFAWVRAFFVWILAALLISAVLFVGGRYLLSRIAPGDLPSGELLQTLGSTAFSAKESGHVKPWISLQVRLLGFSVLGDWNPVQALAFSEDDRRLVSVTPTEMILWDLESASVLARVHLSDYFLDVRALAFYDGGKRIALFSDYDGNQVFDGHSLQPLGALPDAGVTIETVRRGAGGALWYAAAGDTELNIGRIDGLQSRVLFRHPIEPYDFDGSLQAGPRPAQVFLDPAGRRMLLMYDNGNREIFGWDANFALRQVGSASDAAQSPGSLSGFYDPQALFVEAREFESPTAIVRTGAVAPRVDLVALKHTGGFTSSAISSNGRLIATGSVDMLVRIWKAPTLRE